MCQVLHYVCSGQNKALLAWSSQPHGGYRHALLSAVQFDKCCNMGDGVSTRAHCRGLTSAWGTAECLVLKDEWDAPQQRVRLIIGSEKCVAPKMT